MAKSRRQPSRPSPAAGRAPGTPVRDKRWHTRRIIRRVVAALLFGFALLALFKSGLLPQSALQQATPQGPTREVSLPGPLGNLWARFFPPKVDWSNDYSMVQEARRRIAKDGLIDKSPDCLLPIINGNDPVTDTRVRMVMKPGKCGGDPKMPDLFLVKVDRTKGTMTDDAAQRGTFVPLN